MHENRETSTVFPTGDRSGKAQSRTPDVYAGEESDRAVVPVKPPNKEAQASAEVVEGRARTKENTGQSHTPPAQYGKRRVPGFGGSAPCFPLTPSSEVGAVCGNPARTDLCGGRAAMSVPTATGAGSHGQRFSVRGILSCSPAVFRPLDPIVSHRLMGM